MILIIIVKSSSSIHTALKLCLPVYHKDLVHVAIHLSSLSSATWPLCSSFIALFQLFPGPSATTLFGNYAFSVVAPTFWSKLLTQPHSLDFFKSILKTQTFCSIWLKRLEIFILSSINNVLFYYYVLFSSALFTYQCWLCN